ncbi:hypothetical protein NDU88_008777 [Pleurodeles waltl]|uniref:Uncharacterized protein n=1 Tax=Pleurodeles waltl TaxID=8319 RepID=A0AAV7NX15_PLEWA|nr:hypothetical protein NDU88_008777 [Pleurodeles waltl]
MCRASSAPAVGSHPALPMHLTCDVQHIFCSSGRLSPSSGNAPRVMCSTSSAPAVGSCTALPMQLLCDVPHICSRAEALAQLRQCTSCDVQLIARLLHSSADAPRVMCSTSSAPAVDSHPAPLMHLMCDVQHIFCFSARL